MTYVGKFMFCNFHNIMEFQIIMEISMLAFWAVKPTNPLSTHEIWYGGNAIQGDLDAIIFSTLASITKIT
jgi:hypothetical protein